VPFGGPPVARGVAEGVGDRGGAAESVPVEDGGGAERVSDVEWEPRFVMLPNGSVTEVRWPRASWVKRVVRQTGSVTAVRFPWTSYS
jgi:hypothetical protein